jgi:hypothetical protein
MDHGDQIRETPCDPRRSLMQYSTSFYGDCNRKNLFVRPCGTVTRFWKLLTTGGAVGVQVIGGLRLGVSCS